MADSTCAPQRVAVDERRQHDRVAGPFDGRRVDALNTPVRIHDLGVGGCFINSLNEQSSGIELVLEIEIPNEGWLSVKAETIWSAPGFGYAVRFLEMSDTTSTRLERALKRLTNRAPFDRQAGVGCPEVACDDG
jgi:hypothetical protein